MAKNGSKTVKFTDHLSLKWSWEIDSWSPNSRQVTLGWKAEIIADGEGEISTYSSKSWSLHVVNIEGSNSLDYSGSSYIAVDPNETKQVASGEFTLDGVGYTDMAFRLYIEDTIDGNYISAVTVSGSFNIDSFPKGGILVSATNFTDETNPVIQYSLDYLNVTRLQVKLEVNGYAIATRSDLPVVTSGSYTIQLTDAERDKIRKQVTDSIYGSAEFILSTTFSGETQEHTLSKTVEIVNCAPVLNPTYEINGNYTYILAEQNSINVACNATPQKGATIKSYLITCGSKRLNAASGTLTDITVNTINFTAIDSRGVQSAASLTVDLIPYVKLTCNIESTNPIENNNGTITVPFTVSGAIYRGNFNDGGSGNALTLYYNFIIDGSGTGDTWVNPDDIDFSGNTYSFTVSRTVQPTQQVTLWVQAQDNINTVTQTLESKDLLPVFDWSHDDFNFNVPVYIKGVEIPAVTEEGAFTHIPGGSTTFYWRKWNDGLSELWGRASFSVPSGQWSAWGSLYASGARSETNIPFPEGLFVETPNIFTSLRVRSVGGILMAPGGSSAASATQSGAYEVVRGSVSGVGATSAFTISYYVRGRWK